MLAYFSGYRYAGTELLLFANSTAAIAITNFSQPSIFVSDLRASYTHNIEEGFMKTLLRQLFVAIIGGVVAAGVLLIANHIGIGRGPSIALAQTSASVSSPTSPEDDAAKTINYQGQVF